MILRHMIDLISVGDPTANDIGDSVETKTYRSIYADKQSVRQSEFYQASATGLRPEIMFVIRSGEYNQEPRVREKGRTKEYTIIRTYDKCNGYMELICQGPVNGVI